MDFRHSLKRTETICLRVTGVEWCRMWTQIRMITMPWKIQRLNRIESSWHGIRFHRSNTVIHMSQIVIDLEQACSKQNMFSSMVQYPTRHTLDWHLPFFRAWHRGHGRLLGLTFHQLHHDLISWIQCRSNRAGLTQRRTKITERFKLLSQWAFLNSSLLRCFLVDWTFIVRVMFDGLRGPGRKVCWKGWHLKASHQWRMGMAHQGRHPRPHRLKFVHLGSPRNSWGVPGAAAVQQSGAKRISYYYDTMATQVGSSSWIMASDRTCWDCSSLVV